MLTSITSFVFQLSTFLEERIEKLATDANVIIEWSSAVLKPAAYVEKWRLLLWNQAFETYLDETASPKFLKTTKLLQFQDGIIAGRLFYRYVEIPFVF